MYRFGSDKAYIGARYNRVEGNLAGITNKVNIERMQLGSGYFLTPNVLMKFEWADQKYGNFPSSDIRNGGRFKGFMIEGVVGF